MRLIAKAAVSLKTNGPTGYSIFNCTVILGVFACMNIINYTSALIVQTVDPSDSSEEREIFSEIS